MPHDDDDAHATPFTVTVPAEYVDVSATVDTVQPSDRLYTLTLDAYAGGEICDVTLDDVTGMCVVAIIVTALTIGVARCIVSVYEPSSDDVMRTVFVPTTSGSATLGVLLVIATLDAPFHL